MIDDAHSVNKVGPIFRVGAAFIFIITVISFGLLVFVMATEPFEFIALFLLLLVFSVAYYSGYVVFKGYAPRKSKDTQRIGPIKCSDKISRCLV